MSNWIQTYSGIKFDLDKPTKYMINLSDIAHQLSLINRFNGATHEPYSVAQHCIEVSLVLPCLESLLHDAHEAYIGDICTPIKKTIQSLGLSRLCDRIDKVVIECFELTPFDQVPDLHKVDQQMCLTERDQLMSKPVEDWNIPYEPLGILIQPLPWRRAKELFIRRFEVLDRERYK